jgi:hypothetical protein
MNLNEALLERLANWKPGSGRSSLTAIDETSGWSATATADEANALSCLLWELSLRRGPVATEPPGDALKIRAENIAGRATGLLENLRVVEIDAPRGQALLRSQQPAQRGDEVFYYEVLLTGTREGLLRRYRAWQNNGRREQVAFAVTNDALAKLVSDLIAN